MYPSLPAPSDQQAHSAEGNQEEAQFRHMYEMAKIMASTGMVPPQAPIQTNPPMFNPDMVPPTPPKRSFEEAQHMQQAFQATDDVKRVRMSPAEQRSQQERYENQYMQQLQKKALEYAHKY